MEPRGASPTNTAAPLVAKYRNQGKTYDISNRGTVTSIRDPCTKPDKPDVNNHPIKSSNLLPRVAPATQSTPTKTHNNTDPKGNKSRYFSVQLGALSYKVSLDLFSRLSFYLGRGDGAWLTLFCHFQFYLAQLRVHTKIQASS